VTEIRKPVPQTSVIAQRSPADELLERAESAGVSTGDPDNLSITGLQGGAHRLCLAMPESDLLGPCAWPTHPLLAWVALWKIRTGNDIQL
jgi:hypothetical protein